MPKPPTTGGLVYSTDAGRMCPTCRRPVAQCTCRAQAAAAAVPRGDGIVRVSRETKGRGGKAVTVIRGVEADAAGLAALAKQLKAVCGSRKSMATRTPAAGTEPARRALSEGDPATSRVPRRRGSHKSVGDRL